MKTGWHLYRHLPQGPWKGVFRAVQLSRVVLSWQAQDVGRGQTPRAHSAHSGAM